jgi:S1-C subfamily serine protease
VPRPITPRGDLAAMEQTFIGVFEQAAPSVAHITTRVSVRDRFGYTAGTQQGTGSGFVWDNAGTVVTNFHVVGRAQRIEVTVAGQSFAADLVNAEPDQDIAVLRLRGDVTSLRPLAVGTSADLKVGQTALAIGNPYGFDQTLTTGVISALNRRIATNDGTTLGGLIQVDAAINPGNSGGPLLDSAGRLIGITTAIYSPSGTSAGIGFAVPVDTVNDLVPRLLGAMVADPSLGLRNETQYDRFLFQRTDGVRFQCGAVFTEIAPESGAAAAGLRPFKVTADGTIERFGDVIVGVDGDRVRTFDECTEALRRRRAGTKVTLTIVRGMPDAPAVLDVEVPRRPAPQKG